MRPPLPPFNQANAVEKVRGAEDAWNGRNAEKAALAFTQNSVWRNRNTFLRGRAEIVSFLNKKWQSEQQYRLIKELFAFTQHRIAVRYAYEFHNTSGDWFRAYGNENWVFDERGLMTQRFASINDLPISEKERKFHWPLGPRPRDHPGLSELGL